MKINKTKLIVGVLFLLIVVSAVQAFQLVGMNSKISEIKASGIKPASLDSTTSTSSSSGGSVPTNLQNLPGMVGGC